MKTPEVLVSPLKTRKFLIEKIKRSSGEEKEHLEYLLMVLDEWCQFRIPF